MKRTKIIHLLELPPSEKTVLAQGWVRTRRDSKAIVFIELNDGSTINNLQIVVDLGQCPLDEALLKKITTGASLGVEGILTQSPAKGQKVELSAHKITLYGEAPPEEFPLQKKGHSLEFLREIGHLRVRTNTFSAMFRLRHALSFLVHQFFHQKGFFYVHTPIITASDCEGAGEMFQVTTLDLQNLPKKNGQINFEQDFFGKPAHLTVSGQLNGELLMMGLGEIYTFGPTFRAENSNTSRHLAEFWMIEPEMAFYDIDDNQNLAEEFLRYLINEVRKSNADDLAFFEKFYDKELSQKLDMVVNNPFVRIDYTKAVEILLSSKESFEYEVKWGSDLKSEHERYLVEKHFQKPVIVTNYPKEIKAFYMKQNDDGKTVRAMDVLFPGVGEIIGGSQREESYQKIVSRLQELKLPIEEYGWYLDSRRFGSVVHSGFGLGFERLLLFVTGMNNIRDVIAFPRYPQHALF